MPSWAGASRGIHFKDTTVVPGPRAAPASWAAGATFAPGPRTGPAWEPGSLPVAWATYGIFLQKIFV